MRAMNLDELRAMSLDELESLYEKAPMEPEPSGRTRGVVLRYLASVPWVRALDWLMFGAPPFGVDFETRTWWFFQPRFRLGHFLASVGPSRWRETRTMRLNYCVSLLPEPVRVFLYDEIKPIGDGLCLGIGGVNRERGEGEHFFFALKSIP